jgi:hypothetical protein
MSNCYACAWWRKGHRGGRAFTNGLKGMAAEYTKQVESLNSNVSRLWNVNLLCIIGACIGVAALFVAWIHEPPNMPGPPNIRYEPTIVYMVENQYLYYGAAVMFLIGTLTAFASPLGGVLQSGGLVLFAQGIIESGNDQWLDGIDPQQELRVGMCLGMASCSLVLTSLFSPLGTGRLRPARSRKVRLFERLLTISQSMR